jgi:hypothetical protein
MHKIARLTALFSVLLALSGCNVAGLRNAKGYFYVHSQTKGYVVVMDGDPYDVFFDETQIVSKPLPLTDAQKLCDQLNRDLNGSARTERQY